MSKPMTDKTRAMLFESTEGVIDTVSESLDVLYKQNIQLDKLNKIYQNQEINSSDRIDSMSYILEYNILISLLYLDLAVATRVYLNGKHQYEVWSSSRQISIIILEGYKKIYHFTNKNKLGVVKMTERNNSFWVKVIGRIVNEDLTDLRTLYEQNTKKLESFLTRNIEELKTQRDLSIHYDQTPSKVYKMFLTLDIEATMRITIPFLDILKGLNDFGLEMLMSYQRKFSDTKNETLDELSKIVDSLKEYENDENSEHLLKIQTKVEEIKKMINPKT